MRTFLVNLKKRLSHKPPQWEVRLEPDGYTILRDDNIQVHGRWSDVREVFAYKDDLFSYDEICVGLRYSEDGSFWWVGEEHIGSQLFMEELKTHFPGMRQDGFSEVAIPAFAYNRMNLWGEPWSPKA